MQIWSAKAALQWVKTIPQLNISTVNLSEGDCILPVFWVLLIIVRVFSRFSNENWRQIDARSEISVFFVLLNLNVINEFFSFKFEIFSLSISLWRSLITLRAFELYQLIANGDFLTGACQAHCDRTRESRSCDRRTVGYLLDLSGQNYFTEWMKSNRANIYCGCYFRRI